MRAGGSLCIVMQNVEEKKKERKKNMFFIPNPPLLYMYVSDVYV